MPDTDTFLIRSARASDADAVWDLLDSCRAALLDRGIAQWDAIYPSADTVRADIAAARLFVLTANGRCGGAITLDGDPVDAYSGNRSAIAFYQQRGYRQVGELFFPRRSLPFYLFEWSVPQGPEAAIASH